MEQVPCSFCQSTHQRVRYRVDPAKYHPDYLNAVSLVGAEPPSCFTVVECDECGLLYLNPRYSGEQLQAAYPEEQYTNRAGQFTAKILLRPAGEPPAVENRGERPDSEKNRRRLEELRRFKEGGRVLEVGCCNGSFLALLEAEGYQTYGVDFAPKAIENARTAFGLENLFCGELEDARLPDGHFDAVVMYDTIEHLPDPGRTLREIRRISKPDAALIVQTPDFDSLNARVMPRSLLCPAQHLYYFRRRDLERFLGALGYESAGEKVWRSGPLRWGYYAAMHWFARLAVRLHHSGAGPLSRAGRRVLQAVGLFYGREEGLRRLKLVGASNLPAWGAFKTFYFCGTGATVAGTRTAETAEAHTG